jgi:hypothetical protein
MVSLTSIAALTLDSLDTSTAALTPRQQPQLLDGGLTPRQQPQHLDSDFDSSTAASNTSTAASRLKSSLEHLDGGLDTSTAASQQP